MTKSSSRSSLKSAGKKKAIKKSISSKKQIQVSNKVTTLKEKKLIKAKKSVLTSASSRVETCNIMKLLRENHHALTDFNNLIPDAIKHVSLFPKFIKKFEELEKKKIMKWYPLVVFGNGK